MISFGPPQCAWCEKQGRLWITNKNFILFFCDEKCLHEWEQLNLNAVGAWEIVRSDESGLQEMFRQYDQQFKHIITAPDRWNMELELSELNYWKWQIEGLVCDNLEIFGTTERARFIERQKQPFWKEESERLYKETNEGTEGD